MTPPRSRLGYAAAVLFLPALAAVLAGELGPASGEPHFWDKAMHFIAYFVLSTLATLALRPGWKALGAMLGLIAMGGALEIVQGFIGRDCSLMDELANSMGVLAGAFLVWAVSALLVGRGASR